MAPSRGSPVSTNENLATKQSTDIQIDQSISSDPVHIMPGLTVTPGADPEKNQYIPHDPAAHGVLAENMGVTASPISPEERKTDHSPTGTARGSIGSLRPKRAEAGEGLSRGRKYLLLGVFCLGVFIDGVLLFC